MHVKTIIEINAPVGAVERIQTNAHHMGWIECTSQDIEGMVDLDNVTFCYYQQRERTKRFITIHILDDRLRIEAWTAGGIEGDREFQQQIHQLLIKMGHEPSAQ